MQEIDYVVQTAGAFNVLAEAACRSSAELYRLLKRIRASRGAAHRDVRLPQSAATAVSVVARRRAGGVLGEQLPVDPLDIELIAELQRDGRAASGISPAAQRVRAGRLRRDRAADRRKPLRVIAVGNPAARVPAMAWLGIRVQEAITLEEVASALAVPGIDYVVIAAGRYDLMAELCARPASIARDARIRHRDHRGDRPRRDIRVSATALSTPSVPGVRAGRWRSAAHPRDLQRSLSARARRRWARTPSRARWLRSASWPGLSTPSRR